MKQGKKFGFLMISMVIALSLALPSISAGKSRKESGKWMTGDWHQHTFFTDGTNFMGDVEIDYSTMPPTFKIIHKYTNAAPNFTPVREGASGKNEYKGGMTQGFRYGLDFQANSEHGGNRGSRDGFGRLWRDTAFYPMGTSAIPLLGDAGTYNNGCSYLTVDSAGCANLSIPLPPVMWRWQELANYRNIVHGDGDNYMSAFDWINVLRDQFHGREILTGMEWNVPGHEHASTGCLENNGKCIAEFEYRFDQNDTDMTGPAAAGMNWPGKIQTSDYTAANGYPDYASVLGLKPTHAKAISGLAWLDAYHPITSWVNPAHIERAGCGTATDSGYSIAALRDMNDTAPTVFFGFEGMPGHQKASNRGEFSSSACGGGTYGGAGTYIATVGGVWDNLLADGRKIFNFVSSDFHMTRDDFYPGEYAKTYVRVEDNAREDETFTQADILDGIRSGNSFAVHGDLINELDFRVFHGASFRNRSGKNNATMGETLSVEKGDKITVQIRFKTPDSNNCKPGVNASATYVCKVPSVRHVQLIQGRINPTRASKFLTNGNPNPAFNAIDNTVAAIVKTFDASSWSTDGEGFTTLIFTVRNVRNDMFFRIRGTNLGFNVEVKDSTGSKTVYGTDAEGSPLINTPGTNSADRAWDDLWFYSNPIFVSVE
jgi:hypothetical protein